MEPIQNFAQLTAHLKQQNRRKRIAVVMRQRALIRNMPLPVLWKKELQSFS